MIFFGSEADIVDPDLLDRNTFNETGIYLEITKNARDNTGPGGYCDTCSPCPADDEGSSTG